MLLRLLESKTEFTTTKSVGISKGSISLGSHSERVILSANQLIQALVNLSQLAKIVNY
jgi:hypothetical protein